MLLLPEPSCVQPRPQSRHRDRQRNELCAGARDAREVSAVCSCSDSLQEMRRLKALQVSSSRRQSHLVGLGLGLGVQSTSPVWDSQERFRSLRFLRHRRICLKISGLKPVFPSAISLLQRPDLFCFTHLPFDFPSLHSSLSGTKELLIFRYQPFPAPRGKFLPSACTFPEISSVTHADYEMMQPFPWLLPQSVIVYSPSVPRYIL